MATAYASGCRQRARSSFGHGPRQRRHERAGGVLPTSRPRRERGAIDGAGVGVDAGARVTGQSGVGRSFGALARARSRPSANRRERDRAAIAPNFPPGRQWRRCGRQPPARLIFRFLPGPQGELRHLIDITGSAEARSARGQVPSCYLLPTCGVHAAPHTGSRSPLSGVDGPETGATARLRHCGA